MQEEYKDIEDIDDIPMFSGDHWASSIAAKRLEAQKKEDAAGKGKKSDEDKGSGEGSSAVELTDSSKDGLLNQVTEEMRSMRNHFVVVTLIDLAGTPRQEIVDPVPLVSNEFVDTRSAFLERCQMYHWQFDELRNAQHSTLMLLYHLHGMHKAAKAKMAASTAAAAAASTAVEPSAPSARSGSGSVGASRSSKIETAMHDWSTLLAHANEAANTQSWALPPDDLFQRILAQINRSKRDILQEKYNACLNPNCSPQTRSVFIRVLKRIAESFMTCLLQMQSGRDGFQNSQPHSAERPAR